jgi:Zn finger protein HypA/HybF involved in hydrogenase expression
MAKKLKAKKPKKKPTNARCLKCCTKFWSKDKKMYRFCSKCRRANSRAYQPRYFWGA